MNITDKMKDMCLPQRGAVALEVLRYLGRSWGEAFEVELDRELSKALVLETMVALAKTHPRLVGEVLGAQIPNAGSVRFHPALGKLVLTGRDVAEPDWAGDKVVETDVPIRCWPEVGIIVDGPEGPVLTIDPLDGGNCPLVHIGDVLRWCKGRGRLFDRLENA